MRDPVPLKTKANRIIDVIEGADGPYNKMIFTEKIIFRGDFYNQSRLEHFELYYKGGKGTRKFIMHGDFNLDGKREKATVQGVKANKKYLIESEEECKGLIQEECTGVLG